jgi:hypothetical protein
MSKLIRIDDDVLVALREFCASRETNPLRATMKAVVSQAAREYMERNDEREIVPSPNSVS